jgi:hypothetical protein
VPGYINNGIAGVRDILAKILHIMDKRSTFNLHAFISWLLYLSLLCQHNFATIGVLEFVVVNDVYAQPICEKIKLWFNHTGAVRRHWRVSSWPFLSFSQDVSQSCLWSYQRMVHSLEHRKAQPGSTLTSTVAQVGITAAVRHAVIAGYDASNMP